MKFPVPGPGFNPSDIGAISYGLGLPDLRQQIESLGGFIEFQSSPNGGTSVKAIFVMRDEEAGIHGQDSSGRGRRSSAIARRRDAYAE